MIFLLIFSTCVSAQLETTGNGPIMLWFEIYSVRSVVAIYFDHYLSKLQLELNKH